MQNTNNINHIKQPHSIPSPYLSTLLGVVSGDSHQLRFKGHGDLVKNKLTWLWKKQPWMKMYFLLKKRWCSMVKWVFGEQVPWKILAICCQSSSTPTLSDHVWLPKIIGESSNTRIPFGQGYQGCLSRSLDPSFQTELFLETPHRWHELLLKQALLRMFFGIGWLNPNPFRIGSLYYIYVYLSRFGLWNNQATQWQSDIPNSKGRRLSDGVARKERGSAQHVNVRVVDDKDWTVIKEIGQVAFCATT